MFAVARLPGMMVATRREAAVGAVNWIRPGRSSFKTAGVHLRGHKAAYLQAVYLLFAMVVAVIGFLLQAFGSIFRGIAWAVQAVVARREQARQETERLGLTSSDVAGEGERILEANGIALAQEPHGDLSAALVFTLVCLRRGRTQFDPTSAGKDRPERAAADAFR